MRNYLLDTNVVSELRKGNGSKSNANFVRWASAASAGQAISAITLFELEVGVRRVERRDQQQGTQLRTWLRGVHTTFEGRVLAVDEEVSLAAASFHVPDPASDRDAFIAATALVHGLVVVTRNVKDFDTFGVRLLNPWE